MAFVPVGNNSYINSHDIIAVVECEGKSALKIKAAAVKRGTFQSLTKGNAIHSLLIFNNGWVYGSSLMPKTLCARLNMGEYQQLIEQINRYRSADGNSGDEIDEFFLEEEYQMIEEDEGES